MTRANPQPKGGRDQPNKRRLSLHFLSPEEKVEYQTLRRYGCTRDEAIRAIIADPKETRQCSI
jgi:hypothetical protein